MITLIHGDDIEKSRSHLQTLLGKEKEIVRMDGRSGELTDIATAVGSASLLGRSRVVILENVIGQLTKKPSKLDAVIGVLAGAPSEANIIVWEAKELSKGITKKLGAKEFLFTMPAVLFQFLDALGTGKEKTLLALYHRLRQTEAAELTHYMLSRRVRQLLIVRDGGSPAGLPPWQKSRLTTQAGHFTMEKLSSMYQQLLDMEYSTKSGLTPFSLDELVEQFLMSV